MAKTFLSNKIIMAMIIFLQTVCNVFWLLNRYFAASEITWMLNEGNFLLRMLAYPFDNESYLWYYVLFGWGKFLLRMLMGTYCSR